MVRYIYDSIMGRFIFKESSMHFYLSGGAQTSRRKSNTCHGQFKIAFPYVNPSPGYIFGDPAKFTQRNCMTNFLRIHNFGFMAALIFVIIVFRFIKNGFHIFKRYRPLDCYGFSMDKLIGIFSFTVAVLASEMIGGPLNNPRFAWFFWFFVFVILKRWQKLKSTTAD